MTLREVHIGSERRCRDPRRIHDPDNVRAAMNRDHDRATQRIDSIIAGLPWFNCFNHL